VQLRPGLPEQRLDLDRPPLEHHLDALAKPLVRVAHLGGQVPHRRRALAPALGLQRDQRVDEERQPLQRVDHRLAQHGQPPLREPLELPVQHLVAELLLRLEVVIEVALPAEPGLLDHVVHRGQRVAALADQRGGCVEDLSAAIVHEVNLGPIGPNVKWRAASFCKTLTLLYI
jgi:hypothetical protein